MPITVSCPACSSRFSLSDDLYRRRVAGSLVKVKCRNCNAEIAVDATEPATMSSHEAPRKQHIHPPRPKAVTQLGLGEPPPPAGLLATASPLPSDASRSPLPLNPTVTPLPVNASQVTAISQADADSMWADEETIAINVGKTKALPKPPLAPAAAAAEAEPELVDAEEIPPSSSGAPTLDALTLEAGGAHVPHGKPPPDEFLVSLTAGNDGALGAPTIDVTSFAAEIDPPGGGAAHDRELEYHPAPAARSGTIPLFDMNAVLPAANENASRNAAPRAPAPSGTAEPHSEGRARERKFVVAPEAPTTIAARASRRRSPVLWVGLIAAAGVVGAGFGFREHRAKELLAIQAKEQAAPAPPVVNTEASLPAPEAPTTETTEAANAAPTAAVAPPASTAAQNIAVASTRSVAPSGASAVKGSSKAARTEAEPPSSTADTTTEKPIAAVKSTETHNAPAPAAPDTEFDRDAARNALTSAASQASACRKEGDPSGTANLTITFAPSGRVTSAQIQGPPFSGTATGGCIASTMRRASVPAFSGDYVTVSKTIVVQ